MPAYQRSHPTVIASYALAGNLCPEALLPDVTSSLPMYFPIWFHDRDLLSAICRTIGFYWNYGTIFFVKSQ